MVKKLFKHEILSYIRIWLPTSIILLGVALLGRMVQLFENETEIYDTVNGSCIFMYVVAILAAIGITTALGIIRFYKNLFTGEGYLSFTLPVTPSQHIYVKALTATLFQLLTVVTIFLSAAIMAAGDVMREVFLVFEYIFKHISPELKFNLPFYIVEAVLLLILAVHAGFLFFYTCISIGQLFRKNRVLAAVGVYFGFYVITQILGTLTIILFSVLSEYINFEAIFDFIELHKFGFAHAVAGVLTLIILILSAVYFLVSKIIITRKLNLE